MALRDMGDNIPETRGRVDQALRRCPRGRRCRSLPVQKRARRDHGKTPALVAECLAALRSAVTVPVAIKCRSGIDDQDPARVRRDSCSALRKTETCILDGWLDPSLAGLVRRSDSRIRDATQFNREAALAASCRARLRVATPSSALSGSIVPMRLGIVHAVGQGGERLQKFRRQ